MKKIIALITAVVFLHTTSVSPALCGVVDMMTSRPGTLSPALTIIPDDAGRINDILLREGRPLVINIQDLHCAPSVQRSIVRILERLEERYGPVPVYVEGGYGPVDMSWLTGIPDPARRDRIAAGLVDDGALTGAEFFAYTRPDTRRVIGIDDRRMHQENIVRFADHLSRQPAIEREISDMRRVLRVLARRHLGARNRRFQSFLDTARGEHDTARYFARLLAYAGAIARRPGGYQTVVRQDADAYPNMRAYIAATAARRAIAPRRVSRELSELLILLKARVSVAAYQALMRETDNGRNGLFLSGRLPSVCAEAGIPFPGRFSNLGAMARYVHDMQGIHPPALLAEEHAAIARVRAASSHDVAELDIAYLGDMFGIFVSFLQGRVTWEEYRYLLSEWDRFERTWNTYAYNNMPPALRADIERMRAYYHDNEQRNDLFLRNVNRNADVKPSAVTVLITGGFHTDGIRDMVVQRGDSFLSIIPPVSDVAALRQRTYEQRISAQARVFRAQTLAPVLESQLPPEKQAAAVFAVCRRLHITDAPTIDAIENLFRHRGVAPGTLGSLRRSLEMPSVAEVPARPFIAVLNDFAAQIRGSAAVAEGQITGWDDLFVRAGNAIAVPVTGVLEGVPDGLAPELSGDDEAVRAVVDAYGITAEEFSGLALSMQRGMIREREEGVRLSHLDGRSLAGVLFAAGFDRMASSLRASSVHSAAAPRKDGSAQISNIRFMEVAVLFVLSVISMIYGSIVPLPTIMNVVNAIVPVVLGFNLILVVGAELLERYYALHDRSGMAVPRGPQHGIPLFTYLSLLPFDDAVPEDMASQPGQRPAYMGATPRTPGIIYLHPALYRFAAGLYQSDHILGRAVWWAVIGLFLVSGQLTHELYHMKMDITTVSGDRYRGVIGFINEFFAYGLAQVALPVVSGIAGFSVALFFHQFTFGAQLLSVLLIGLATVAVAQVASVMLFSRSISRVFSYEQGVTVVRQAMIDRRGRGHVGMADGDNLGALNRMLGKRIVDFMLAMCIPYMSEMTIRKHGIAVMRGGDEFAFYIPEQNPKKMNIIAEMIRAVDRRFHHPQYMVCRISASVASAHPGLEEKLRLFGRVPKIYDQLKREYIVPFNRVGDEYLFLVRPSSRFGESTEERYARTLLETAEYLGMEDGDVRFTASNGGKLFAPTMSLGAVPLQKGHVPGDDSFNLSEAEQNLTRAKQAGRNRSEVGAVERVDSTDIDTIPWPLSNPAHLQGYMERLTERSDSAVDRSFSGTDAERAAAKLDGRLRILHSVVSQDEARRKFSALLDAGSDVTLLRFSPSYRNRPGKGSLPDQFPVKKGDGWQRFKTVNEIYNHDAADRVITLLHLELYRALYDLLGDDAESLIDQIIITRLPPDEFVVMIPSRLLDTVRERRRDLPADDIGRFAGHVAMDVTRGLNAMPGDIDVSFDTLVLTTRDVRFERGGTLPLTVGAVFEALDRLAIYATKTKPRPVGFDMTSRETGNRIMVYKTALQALIQSSVPAFEAAERKQVLAEATERFKFQTAAQTSLLSIIDDIIVRILHATPLHRLFHAKGMGRSPAEGVDRSVHRQVLCYFPSSSGKVGTSLDALGGTVDMGGTMYVPVSIVTGTDIPGSARPLGMKMPGGGDLYIDAFAAAFCGAVVVYAPGAPSWTAVADVVHQRIAGRGRLDGIQRSRERFDAVVHALSYQDTVPDARGYSPEMVCVDPAIPSGEIVYGADRRVSISPDLLGAGQEQYRCIGDALAVRTAESVAMNRSHIFILNASQLGRVRDDLASNAHQQFVIPWDVVSADPAIADLLTAARAHGISFFVDARGAGADAVTAARRRGFAGYIDGDAQSVTGMSFVTGRFPCQAVPCGTVQVFTAALGRDPDIVKLIDVQDLAALARAGVFGENDVLSVLGNLVGIVTRASYTPSYVRNVAWGFDDAAVDGFTAEDFLAAVDSEADFEGSAVGTFLQMLSRKTPTEFPALRRGFLMALAGRMLVRERLQGVRLADRAIEQYLGDLLVVLRTADQAALSPAEIQEAESVRGLADEAHADWRQLLASYKDMILPVPGILPRRGILNGLVDLILAKADPLLPEVPPQPTINDPRYYGSILQAA